MLLLLHTFHAVAAVLQILHTNDLHASLKTAGHPLDGKREMGGWAQLAATMNRLEAEAAQQGIPTIRLDGGDFFEGTAYYFADQGRPVLKAFDALKFDAAALGNHDWLCGVEALNSIYSEGWFHTPLLAANFLVNKKNLSSLSSQLQDPQHGLITLSRAGNIKVNVFGLTTDEGFYDWAAEVQSNPEDVLIDDPIRHGNRMMRFIRKLNSALRGTAEWHNRPQLNIALTHIGHEQDMALGRVVYGIDGIVGGHSHKLLHQPLLANPGFPKSTPVFQTGYNGKFVGVIRVQLDTTSGPGKQRKKPELLSYHLEPVFNDGPKDPEVQCHVDEAERLLSKEYGSKFLEEHIGWSQVPLRTGEFGPTPFALFAAESIRQAVQKPASARKSPEEDLSADVGFDIGSFHGLVDQAPGFITRKTLMQMYPRKFETEHKRGATIYRANMSGKVLGFAVRLAAQYGVFMSSPKMTFGKWTTKGDAKVGLFSTKINGAEFHDWFLIPGGATKNPLGTVAFTVPIPMPADDFVVALPELFARGAQHMTELHDIVIGELKDTGITIWSAMERYLRHTDKNGKVIERPIEDFASRPTGELQLPSHQDLGAPENFQQKPKEIIGDYHDFLREWTDTVRRCKDARSADSCT